MKVVAHIQRDNKRNNHARKVRLDTLRSQRLTGRRARVDQKTLLNNDLLTLAKLPQLERTGSPVSHSRWAAMPSDNGGTATSIGDETLLLHDDPICHDTTIVQLRPDLQLKMNKLRKHLSAAAVPGDPCDLL